MKTEKAASEAVEHILIERLQKMGMGQEIIPGFIKNLTAALREYPEMTREQANKKIRSLGWDDMEFDYRTWELAVAALDQNRRYI